VNLFSDQGVLMMTGETFRLISFVQSPKSAASTSMAQLSEYQLSSGYQKEFHNEAG
jgi:hypothetical protein